MGSMSLLRGQGNGTGSAFLHPRTSLGSLSPSLSPAVRSRGRPEASFQSMGSPSLSPSVFRRSSNSARYPTDTADEDTQFLSLSNSMLLDQFDRQMDESYYNPETRTGTGSEVDTMSCMGDHDHDVIMGDMYGTGNIEDDLVLDPQDTPQDIHRQNNDNNDGENHNTDSGSKGSDPVPDPSSPTLSEKNRRDKLAFVVTPPLTMTKNKPGSGNNKSSGKGSGKGVKGRGEVNIRPHPTVGKTPKSRSFFSTSKTTNTTRNDSTPLAGQGNKNGGGTGTRMNFKDAPVMMSRLLSFRRGDNGSSTKSSLTGPGKANNSSSGMKSVATPGLSNLQSATKQPLVQGKAQSAMKSKSPFVRATQAVKQGLSFRAFRRPSIYGEDDNAKKGSE